MRLDLLHRPALLAFGVTAALLAGGCASTGAPSSTGMTGSAAAPGWRVDAAWPKPLPNRWILGQVSGIATDADDHVWVLQRPGSLTEDERSAALNPPQANCCTAAPPVLEFDAAGNLLRSWGGKGTGYDWPENEHGIHVDAKGFVWITGNGDNDGQVLKFTRDGKFVMQIGKVGPQTGSADTTRLGRAAGGRGRCRRQRGLRGRRLPQQPRDRVRCRQRRLQAPLGRLRPAAGRGRQA